jgi:hypothetical protein
MTTKISRLSSRTTDCVETLFMVRRAEIKILVSQLPHSGQLRFQSFSPITRSSRRCANATTHALILHRAKRLDDIQPRRAHGGQETAEQSHEQLEP